MLAQAVQLAGPDVELGQGRRRGDAVRVGSRPAGDRVAVRQLGQHGGQGLVRWGDPREELGEHRGVCLGHRAEGVQRGEDELLLLLGQVDLDDRDRRFAPRERLLDPGVAIEQVAGSPVPDHPLDPADRAERGGDRRPLGLGVTAPVRRVGDQLLRRNLGLPDDPAGPGNAGRPSRRTGGGVRGTRDGIRLAQARGGELVLAGDAFALTGVVLFGHEPPAICDPLLGQAEPDDRESSRAR